MNKLSKSDVLHVAKLSKLELTEAEIEKFRNQLSAILDYVAELNQVETKDVEITAQVTGLFNVAVADEIKKSSISYDDIRKNAPEFCEGNFIVPGVFGEK